MPAFLVAARDVAGGPTEPQVAGVKQDTASTHALSLPSQRSLPVPHWPGLQGRCSLAPGRCAELRAQTGSGGQMGSSS